MRDVADGSASVETRVAGEEAAPQRKCDIVMKGGITSGIVYPPLVRTLADHFRFVNIGGTSAGAIAACLTAAAEYRRQTRGDMAGFDRLAKIPDDLSSDGRLFKLFRPNRDTTSLFQQIRFIFKGESVVGFLVRLAASAFLSIGAPFAIAGVVIGMLAGISLAVTSPGTTNIIGAVALLFLFSAIGVSFALWRTAVRAQQVLIKNGYGLSTGVSDTAPGDGTYLGTWLSNLIDEVAGLSRGEHLTFGHLWYGRCPQTNDLVERPEAPLINLEMVATCLSHGRPYTFPTGEHQFYFIPRVLRRYVPGSVVEWMEHRQRPSSKSGSDRQLADYSRMPYERDLPITLVARMSLAFPGLLAAVPLGAVPFGEIRSKSSTGEAAGVAQPPPEDCWFVDGGLSSNFPIHLFDAPLPRWPTFGVSLGAFNDAEEEAYDKLRKAGTDIDESQYVWMAPSNGASRQENWTRFTDIAGYIGNAMLGAMKDWNDNVQSRVPGFRDRIVTVRLRSCEGGLNLNMPTDVIDALVKRGAAAGQRLVERFACVSDGSYSRAMDWDNHRWVRARVLLSAGQKYFDLLARGYNGGQPGDVSYDELMHRSEARTKGPYVWPNVATRRRSRAILAKAASTSKRLHSWEVRFDRDDPQPVPDLVKRPRG